MLTLHIEGEELYDEVNQVFGSSEGFTIILEHSLVSMSKWEERFCKPFLDKETKKTEEVVAYVEAMLIEEIDAPVDWLDRLTIAHMNEITDYIDSPASATTFNDRHPNKPSNRYQIITSELVYYWMVAHAIPFECETWHLNRLFALIRICNLKNSKEQKMSPGEIAARNRELNEARKAKLGTSG
jgi:hypothetical protein